MAGLLKLLVRCLRRIWLGVRVTVRSDSGFCRRLMLEWCDNGVDYIIGLPRNERLLRTSEAEAKQVAAGFRATGEKQRRFPELFCQAKTWTRERRVIACIEHSKLGANSRFMVTRRNPVLHCGRNRLWIMRGIRYRRRNGRRKDT